MSGSMWGADVEGLRNLANIFDTSASDVTGSITAVSSALSTTPWVGSDAETFQSQWTSTTQPQLQHIADHLLQCSDELKRHADEQHGASTEGGGIGDGGGGGGNGDDGSWWDSLYGILGPIVTWTGNLVTAINQTIKQLDDLGRLSEAFKNGKAWSVLKGLGRGLGAIGVGLNAGELVDSILDGDGWRAGDALVGLGLGVAGLVTVATPVGWALLAGGAAWGLASALTDGPVTEAAWNLAKDAGSWSGDTAVDAWNAGTDAINNAIDVGSEVISDTVSSVTDGVSDFAGDVAGGVSDAVGGAVDTITSF